MAFDLFDLIIKRLQDPDMQDGPDIPADVRSFLGKLGMLNDVPIYYIIPDERYLPMQTSPINGRPVEQGAFKFFWLDKEWIECLMDGALSIGGDDDRELVLTKAMGGNYVAEVYLQEKKNRLTKQLYGAYPPEEFKKQYDTRIQKYLNNGQPDPTRAQNNWCYTGFLMRSSLISGWPGVEVIAQGNDPNEEGQPSGQLRPLQLMRMDLIAPDTLFCICEGIISNVEIKQPAEALHFGMDDNYMVNGTKVNISAPDNMCSGGVIDVLKLSSDLHTKNSAQLAEQMVAKPLKFIVNISWNPDQS
jgi:hypothetical protein